MKRKTSTSHLPASARRAIAMMGDKKFPTAEAALDAALAAVGLTLGEAALLCLLNDDKNQMTIGDCFGTFGEEAMSGLLVYRLAEIKEPSGQRKLATRVYITERGRKFMGPR